MNPQARDRLNSLIETGHRILASATKYGGQLRKGFVTGEPYRTAVSYGIDAQLASQWRTSCLRFLETQFGSEHSYYKSFQSGMSHLVYERVNTSLGILAAVRDDDEQEKLMPQPDQRKTLEEWAGSRHLTTTLLFTDIVKSTLIGQKRGDSNWIEDLFVHFDRARKLTADNRGFVVKAIGDSLMIAFHTPTQAVDFAVAFAKDTGVKYIGIRIGVHTGQVQIRDNDIYGLNVNLTSRIQQSVSEEGIHVSDRVKEDYERDRGKSSLFRSEQIELPSFGQHTLWKANSKGLRVAWVNQVEARTNLFSSITLHPRA